MSRYFPRGDNFPEKLCRSLNGSGSIRTLKINVIDTKFFSVTS